MNPFCWVGSVAAPYSREYRLIFSIGVLEHLGSNEVETAIANLCYSGNYILFPSAPDDFKKPTHLSVNMLREGAEAFTRHGFRCDLDFEGSFNIPWAVCFGKTGESSHHPNNGYEWKIRLQHKEIVEPCSVSLELLGRIEREDKK